ncbi:hypothetical protein DSUL_80003 [Desulfovibrionales bacterium]
MLSGTAKKYSIDRYLLQAVIELESDFKAEFIAVLSDCADILQLFR